MKLTDKITEQPSPYSHLEQMEPGEILRDINREDHRVADAVERTIPSIEAFVKEAEVLHGSGHQRSAGRAGC